MTLIAIAEPEGVHRQRLLTALSALGPAQPAVARTLEQALEVIDEQDPEVLVIGPSLVCDVALDLVTHLDAEGRTASVIVPDTVTTECLRSAMRAGATDVVGIGESMEDLANAVERARAWAVRARGCAEGEGKGRGKVVTVFSTKGGVGKTVLATNIGVALARDTGKRVAVIDLDLEFGDVAIMLGVKPSRTIHDAIQVYDRLDAEMLAGFMEEHTSGLKLLLAPTRPEEAESIPAARIGQIIDLVAESFDYVVIDTCPSFSESALAALDRSDEVYVVTTMDVASIKNTRISLQKLRQLGYTNGRLRLVLNRADSKVLLEPSEVDEAIGGKVFARIPSDRLVPRSVNKGVPVVLEMPKSEVARSILVLSKDAATVTAKEAGDVA